MPELINVEPGSPDWLAARRAGVTATDIVTILGLSSYDSVYSLFWRKLGQVPEVEDNDRFRLGRELEPYVIQRWGEENAAIGDRLTAKAGLFRHSERSWQLATPDRLLFSDGRLCPLEVKTWADADRHSWQDDPPAKVRAQVLWQMDVMDVAAGHVGVVFLPSGEFRSYTIEHTHSYQHEHKHPEIACPCDICRDLLLMRAAGEEFMARLRLELPPPDPDASLATLAAVRARFTRQPDKTADVDPDLWGKYEVCSLTLNSYQEVKREYEIQLREQAGEASVLTVDGQPVARRVISDAQVKAHTRHQDYLKRIKQGDDSE